MSKDNLLFWIFFALYLFISYHIYLYFISPLLVKLFATDVMDIVAFPIIFIPIPLVLARKSKNYFLAN
ncbi:hypothetical protein [Ornithinibacillus scapharcae]|uniref:hypothetical protein n=1 Tax=Ornithinibacillus scapharcae TaxID=1147159 RepID=UPI000225B58C|nr:hypothetical protein [Ornithinibacillus scapharcae]